MFPLYSSANHTFVITRGVHAKNLSPESPSVKKSFTGCDEPVSWSCVRLVKCITVDVETCPICLDSFTCARITKCGHSFCLICLIRHIQCSAFQDGPKCPCCSSSLHLVDVRPVDFFTVSPPRSETTAQPDSGRKASEKWNKNLAATKMRFVKLYRVKGCASPFIPDLSHPRRSSPFALPAQSEDDAKFCRFSYVEPRLLREKLDESLNELKELPSEGDGFEICRELALEVVTSELQTAIKERAAENEMTERYQNVSSGVYQPHHPRLISASHMQPQPESEHAENNNHATTEEGESDGMFPQSPRNQKCRSASIESEVSETTTERHRSASVESENSSMTPDPTLSPGSPRQRHPHERSWTFGTLYLGQDENIFYQSEDGQLCFLCGFNIQCLRAEFSTYALGSDPDSNTEAIETETNSASAMPHTLKSQQQQPPSRRIYPLPDTVQGRVIEVEHLILTRQLRQRLRFLSHLPLGIPVCFVEISLGNVLSQRTKKSFAKEFHKRRSARDRRSRAEKRADDQARRKEEQRIEEYRSQIPIVNRAFRSEAIDITSDAFGPALGSASRRPATSDVTSDSDVPSSLPQQPEPPTMSFSTIARKASAENQRKSREVFSTNDFPALGSSGNDFPPLGSSTFSSKGKSHGWNNAKSFKPVGAKKGANKSVW